MHFSLLLAPVVVDDVRSQTRIETWTAGVEVSVQRRIMKNVWQSNLTLEGYKAEILVPLLEVHDQWESFFDHQDSVQLEEESAK